MNDRRLLLLAAAGVALVVGLTWRRPAAQVGPRYRYGDFWRDPSHPGVDLPPQPLVPRNVVPWDTLLRDQLGGGGHQLDLSGWWYETRRRGLR